MSQRVGVQGGHDASAGQTLALADFDLYGVPTDRRRGGGHQDEAPNLISFVARTRTTGRRLSLLPPDFAALHLLFQGRRESVRLARSARFPRVRAPLG